MMNMKTLGFFFAFILVIGFVTQPVQAADTYQQAVSPCGEALLQTASRAGVEGYISDFEDSVEYFNCHMDTYIPMDDGSDVAKNFTIAETYPEYDISTCGSDALDCQPTTFHGYPAHISYHNTMISIAWLATVDEQAYYLAVSYSINAYYIDEAEWAVAETEAMAMAEALWRASDPLLPGSTVGVPLPPEDLPPSGDPPSGDPDIPGETIPDNYGIPPETYSDTNIPNSLGPLATTPFVPLAGGLIGTLVGGLVSLMITSRPAPIPGRASTATPQAQGPTARPSVGQANEAGLVWSERPWDEAGQGYVTREEYERTRDLLAKGYRWTNSGWQTPEAIQQSADWESRNRQALEQEEAARQAEQKRRQAALEEQQAKERERLIAQFNQEPPPSAPPPAEPESHWGFDPSADAGYAGDLGSKEMTPGINAEAVIYENQYYDAKDLTGDITFYGMDAGNYKADLQMGKVQGGASFGFSEEKNKKSFSAGIFGEASSCQLTGEGVLGNQYAGVTGDGQIDGPKADGFLGYQDGVAGASVGVSLISAETTVGVNVAGANVGVRGGISFGLEFGFKVSAKKAEIKFGPFKLGYSIGKAKAGR